MLFLCIYMAPSLASSKALPDFLTQNWAPPSLLYYPALFLSILLMTIQNNTLQNLLIYLA